MGYPRRVLASSEGGARESALATIPELFSLRVGKRFALERRLGRGSFGDVFEALDRRRGARVALKLLREPRFDVIQMFKREFRALSEIRHPGLIRLYELFVGEADAFFTMEVVSGLRFDAFVLERGRDPEALLTAIGALCDALHALHASGHLHRDIKPSNLMVEPSGRVRLLDFGLACPIAANTGPTGSLPYIAPELFEGAPSMQASDAYGVGVLAYEALTGATPTAKKRWTDALHAKRARDFPHPREVLPAGARGAAEAIWALLDPDPARRPTMASLAEQWRSPSKSRSVLVTSTPSFVGRDHELDCLARFSREGPARGAGLLVEGEAGIGKTALLRRFFDLETDRSLLGSRCHPQEYVPFRAFDGVVEGIASLWTSLAPEQRAGLVPHLSHDLLVAFPSLAMVADRPTDHAIADPQERRQRALQDLCSLVAGIASRSPLVLWIDDAHWADRDSLELLERVAEQAPAVRIVVSRRPLGPNDAAHSPWLERFEKLSLERLDEATSRALVAAELASGPIDLASITSAGAGLPFLLQRLARAKRTDDSGTAEPIAMARLAPSARGLLERLSLLEQPIPIGWLASSPDEGAQVIDALTWLAWERLATIDADDHVSIYHDLIRRMVETTLADDARVAIHDGLAKDLERAGAGPDWIFPHYRHSGQKGRAFVAAEHAARLAGDRYAFELATRWLREAESLAPTVPDHTRVLVKLGDVLSHGGLAEQAAEAYRNAEAKSDPTTASRTASKRVFTLLRCGHVEEGIGAITETLARSGIRVPATTLGAIGRLAIERARLAARRLRNSPIEEPDRADLQALWLAATTLSLYDPLKGFVMMSQFSSRARDSSDREWHHRADDLDAALLATIGRFMRPSAALLLASVEERARRDEGNDGVWAAATMGSTSWGRGDFAACAHWTGIAYERGTKLPEREAFEASLVEIFRVPSHVLARGCIPPPGAEQKLAAARARNDLFAALPYQQGLVTLAYLHNGQIELAKQLARTASGTVDAFRSAFGAFERVRTDVAIALFEGRASDAWSAATHGLRTLATSGQMALEAVEAETRYMLARAALAAARDEGRVRAAALRAVASTQARFFRASPLVAARPWGLALDAQLALVEWRAHADQKLLDALDAFKQVGLLLEASTLDSLLSGRPAPLGRVLFPSVASRNDP